MAIEVALEGRLGAPPQWRTSARGKPYLSISIAAGSGDAVEWVIVAAFDQLAADLPANLEKGERLYCEGKLTVWRRDSASGPKASLSVAATKIVVLDRIGRRRRPIRKAMVETVPCGTGQ